MIGRRAVRSSFAREKPLKKCLELSRLFALGFKRGERMNHQRVTLAGFIAVLAIVLITLFTMTTSKDTQRTIGESIPHGPSEKPVSK